MAAPDAEAYILTWEMLQFVKREDRRQSYCPTCKTVRGMPISVAITMEQRLIAYRCPRCADQWKVVHLPLATATVPLPVFGRTEA